MMCKLIVLDLPGLVTANGLHSMTMKSFVKKSGREVRLFILFQPRVESQRKYLKIIVMHVLLTIE